MTKPASSYTFKYLTRERAADEQPPTAHFARLTAGIQALLEDAQAEYSDAARAIAEQNGCLDIVNANGYVRAQLIMALAYDPDKKPEDYNNKKPEDYKEGEEVQPYDPMPSLDDLYEIEEWLEVTELKEVDSEGNAKTVKKHGRAKERYRLLFERFSKRVAQRTRLQNTKAAAALIHSLDGCLELLSPNIKPNPSQNGTSHKAIWPEFDIWAPEKTIEQRAKVLLYHVDHRDLDGLFDAVERWRRAQTLTAEEVGNSQAPSQS